MDQCEVVVFVMTQTAVLIAMRILLRRKPLRDAFKEMLRAELHDLGIHLVQLERGGFGLIPVRALDGAPAITAKKNLMEVAEKLKRVSITYSSSSLEVKLRVRQRKVTKTTNDAATPRSLSILASGVWGTVCL